MGHMDNEAHKDKGIQGVWGTWPIGYRGYGLQGLWWGPTKAFCGSVNVHGVVNLFSGGGTPDHYRW